MAQTDATSSPSLRRPRWPALVALLLLVAGIEVVWQRYFATYHLATVQAGVLYRDGAANIRQLRSAVDQVNAKTVICLIDDQELADPAKPQFRQEMDFLKQKGVRVERIPITLGGWPTTPDVQRFLDLVNDKGNQPVLVHCAQGVRRTAMMVAAYQESVLGYDKEKAKAAILTFGHSDKTVNDIKRFIDGYDSKTKTVVMQVAAVERNESEK